jgi:hypothetical protein
MKNGKSRTTSKTIFSFVLFSLLFASIVFLVGYAVFNAAPNTNSLFGVIFSFMCAVPLAFSLFFNQKFNDKVKPFQRFLLPILIFPLCILLSLGWNLYQQRPEGLFQLFVMDPIPDGISNIQGDDVSGGFDMEIILAFNATPEAIDKIIAKNELTPYSKETASYFIQDPDYRYFRDINWNRNWVVYTKHNSERVEETTIWVNPEKDTVLFRYISG